MRILKKPSLLVICLFSISLMSQLYGQDFINNIPTDNSKTANINLNHSEVDNNPENKRFKLKRDIRNKRKLEYQKTLQHNIQKSKSKSISDHGEFLKANQLIVEYKIVDSKIEITITDKFIVKTKSISFPDDLPTQIEKLHGCLTNYKMAINSPLKSYKEFIKSASKLFEYLILPIKQEITDHDLVLILDGPLHHIPFEVLLEKKPDLNKKDVVNYNNLDYLLKKHKISYAYSYDILNKKVNENNGGFLGFAPNFNTDSLANNNINGTRSFNTLQFNFKEIEIIEKLFSHTKALKGVEATEQAFYDLSESYNVLHFSTHAIVDNLDPYNSYLVFSSSTDANNDGYLYVDELSKMKLSANMAVLAACNTGNGKTVQKEGIISLGSSFLRAGCSSVVSSLWLAHDESTSQIMENFYHFLSKGATKDEALQKAKLKYVESAAPLTIHPFYWANFVVIGDTQPLKYVDDSVGKEKFRNWLYIFVIIAFGLGIVLIKKEVL